MSQVSTEVLTALHIGFGLIAIGTGLVALGAMLANHWLGRWVAVFLACSLLTTVTGYIEPHHAVMTNRVLGVFSLLAIGVAAYALYARRLAGRWHTGFILAMVGAVYLTSFAALEQTFQKQPALIAVAPNETAAAFIVAQLLMLSVYLWLATELMRQFSRDALGRGLDGKAREYAARGGDARGEAGLQQVAPGGRFPVEHLARGK